MTDKEMIEKLNEVIEKSFEAFKALCELSVCTDCLNRNEKIVDEIFNKVEAVVKLKKEIK